MERIDSCTAERALFRIAATRRIEADAAAREPAHALMRRAGGAAARLALALAPHARRIWIAAGPGNNGGDGFEAAFVLRQAGKEVVVTFEGDPQRLPADAARSLARAREAGATLTRGAAAPVAADLAIDALLGIGAARPPQGALAEAIRQLNAFEGGVLALDVPSGLDADTGQPHGHECVVARHTLSLLTLKPGLFTGSGRDHAGSVWFDDLGVQIPSGPAGPSIAPDARLVGPRGAARPSPARLHASHKGSFGDVAVIGGAPGMTGAALLAARAAHAAGAGRVHVALLAPANAPESHDPMRPELMFRATWLDQSPPEVLAATTVVCGCGGGKAVASLLPRLLHGAARLVLDADALNAVAADAALGAALRDRAARAQATVLTPHPLEAARLLGCPTSQVQADRLHAAQALSDATRSVVVLKGSGSIVAAPERVPVIVASGNAALATAGTGDVLAGWLGGLWAPSPSGGATSDAFDIAVRATVAHGAAADPAAPGPLRAADLVEVLHRRLRDRR